MYMLRIGEFATLARVSVRTLRHYEEMELLSPARVDPDSGYRYYDLTQLPELHRILALREAGISLPHIRHVLSDDPSDAPAVIEQQINRLEQSIRDEKRRLALLQSRLALAREDADPPALDIRVVNGPRQFCLRASYQADTVSDLWPLATEASRLIHATLSARDIEASGPQIVRYLVDGFREEQIPVELMVPIPNDSPLDELPAGLHACTLEATGRGAYTVYRGRFGDMAGTYRGLIRWLTVNKVYPEDYPREIQLSGPIHTLSWEDEAVVAIMIPYSKNPQKTP